MTYTPGLTDTQLRATAVPVSLTSTTITGNVATATTDSGNPVKIGGVASGAGAAVTAGQRTDAWFGTNGQIITGSYGVAGADAASNVNGYLLSSSGGTNPLAAAGYVFNGTTWDRQRGMGLAATTGDTGAKTATGDGATQTNVGNKGVCVVVNLGTVSGTTPTAVFKLQGSLDGGTTWYDIPGATTASLTATGVYAISVYPGTPTVAGTTTSISGTASCGQPLPRTWRVVWTIGGTTPSFTITNIQITYIVN